MPIDDNRAYIAVLRRRKTKHRNSLRNVPRTRTRISAAGHSPVGGAGLWVWFGLLYGYYGRI